MKKLFLGLLIIVLLLSVTACDKKETSKKTTKEDEPTVEKKTGQIHEHCTRTGSIDSDSSAEMIYEIYYTGDVLNLINSTERVTSTKSEVLDEYEAAYRKIHSYYADIDHYDTEVIRTNSSVASKMTIDYDKIDLAKLIALEGEADNIFENGKPMISKYKELAKKMGVTCEEVK